MFKRLLEKSKNKKGFTLVELIVVIVIILILAAVLVPSLLKYIDKANKANCKADAATILSQLQADYAASQAFDASDAEKVPEKIAGVTVTLKTATTSESITTPATLDAAKDNAQYIVTGNEITDFQYNNGKYTATWHRDAPGTGDTDAKAGWTVGESKKK